MMTLVYIAMGLYLGLFLASKGWLTFKRAAMPWVWLTRYIRNKFGNQPRVYTPRHKARDDVRENSNPHQP